MQHKRTPLGYRLLRELSPEPLAPEARIIPLDQAATALLDIHCLFALLELKIIIFAHLGHYQNFASHGVCARIELNRRQCCLNILAEHTAPGKSHKDGQTGRVCMMADRPNRQDTERAARDMEEKCKTTRKRWPIVAQRASSLVAKARDFCHVDSRV